MLCASCSRLAIMTANRKCMRCQGDIFNNISVICDSCSDKSKQCSICMKNIAPKNRARSCNCGKK